VSKAPVTYYLEGKVYSESPWMVLKDRQAWVDDPRREVRV
jgi:hypothetical protein